MCSQTEDITEKELLKNHTVAVENLKNLCNKFSKEEKISFSFLKRVGAQIYHRKINVFRL